MKMTSYGIPISYRLTCRPSYSCQGTSSDSCSFHPYYSLSTIETTPPKLRRIGLMVVYRNIRAVCKWRGKAAIWNPLRTVHCPLSTVLNTILYSITQTQQIDRRFPREILDRPRTPDPRPNKTYVVRNRDLE